MKTCSLLAMLMTVCGLASAVAEKAVATQKDTPRKVYLSYILHGNMNYDRYVRPTIWRDFPIIYGNLLDFIEAHPDFKGQLQFSGQTFNSLKLAAPEVIEHAIDLHRRGILNFTGTFYSEPVNINMDGETNLRCAELGTSIIMDALGSTDGFYLQERAYHPQLPWILNKAGISWIPVITNDDTMRPFKLQGMDGSETVCVPTTHRGALIETIEKAPSGSLLVIEDDYEIPQSFTAHYATVKAFDEARPDIEVEWVLVKDYLERYGVDPLRYIDHTVKALELEHGTYSRWTADPLDIVVQEYTRKAMSDFRAATLVNSLLGRKMGAELDLPLSQSDLAFPADPLAWNIEQIHHYPWVESSFLKQDGVVTLLSRAEHLLVWAVNSDSKGWFPLYERRRERINSFQNSSLASRDIIQRGMEQIAGAIKAGDYDKHFVLFNAEPERTVPVTLEVQRPYEVFDVKTGKKLKSEYSNAGGTYTLTFEARFPGFGYLCVGLQACHPNKAVRWNEGDSISNGQTSVKVHSDVVVVKSGTRELRLDLDPFMIKALAEMTAGEGDGEWRNGIPYGPVRTQVRNGLYPELRVDRQLDWLVHMQQVFRIVNDRVEVEMTFDFPHPTLLRKSGPAKSKMDFDPYGLTLNLRTGKVGKVYYDIPFGISAHDIDTLSYYCPISSSIFEFDQGGGWMLSMATGAQAFYADSGKGDFGVFLGASTTSGPIRDVGMTIESKERVMHHPAWYLEPFHGVYHHRFMLYPYAGTWERAHLPLVARQYTEPVYSREIQPGGDGPASRSLMELDAPGVEVTSMESTTEGLRVRLNNKEKHSVNYRLTLGKTIREGVIHANGILELIL
jgi:hypothetical protein